MQERNLSIPKPTAEQIMAEMKADIAKLERPYPSGRIINDCCFDPAKAPNG